MNNKKQNERGFSLIELMIAMLIGILLLLAATGLFMSNKRIYNEQNDMGRLQENGRFAVDLLTKDIRMASYGGCVDDLSSLTNVTTNAATVTNLHNATNAIEGIDDKAGSSTWSPSGSTETVANITNGTDAITLRYLEPISDTVAFTTGSTMASDTSAIPVTCSNTAGTAENCNAAGSDHITANENMAITDCSAGDIFIATGATTNTITHSATLNKAYDDSAQVSRYVTTRYYIGTAANTNKFGNAVPALFKYSSVAGVATTQELIEGVERMEILYGVDTNSDSIPDTYLAAGAAGLTSSANWDDVISVKVSLLLRTIDENVNIDNDTKTYTLLNAAAYNPADTRVRRRTYTFTVQIRNRVS